MREKHIFAAAFGLAILITAASALACTNFLITRGASKDGSTLISYAADSHELYGELYFRPAQSHAPGTMHQVIEWDTGKPLGKIKQVARTYSVVGNMNEHQLAIGETTYTGRKELKDPKGLVDYGSLMYLALQRAKTARAAIKVMTDLVAEYGYYSTGESFSISDPKEAWIMEMIGKGPGNKGAVWVARRIPDGYVSAHANQARIKRFPLNDKANCLYSPDVISFARDKGLFKGKDEEFSFADAYAPMEWSSLRICEARVWSMFRRVSRKAGKYISYVKGIEGAEPMPLWIKPDRKISVHDVMELMRDHFEGTEFDLHNDVGAGPFKLPYRWRPLIWELGGKKGKGKKKRKGGVKYLNERATATQQTGFSFVAQSRAKLPGPIGGVLWFGVDDANSSVYVPMYAGIREVPRSFAVGTADFNRFSWDSAFWVFNFVSNYAYLRYSDMIKDIKKVQRYMERDFFKTQPAIERKALALYRKDPEAARALLTQYSLKQGKRATDRWRKLGQELLVKYLDGNVRDAKGKITHPPYPQSWYKRIAKQTGDHFKVKKLKAEIAREKAAKAAKARQKNRKKKSSKKKTPTR